MSWRYHCIWDIDYSCVEITKDIVALDDVCQTTTRSFFYLWLDNVLVKESVTFVTRLILALLNHERNWVKIFRLLFVFRMCCRECMCVSHYSVNSYVNVCTFTQNHVYIYIICIYAYAYSLWKEIIKISYSTLLWRHNGHDGISNHQPHDCLLNRLFRRGSKKTSKLRVTGFWDRWIPRTNGQ